MAERVGAWERCLDFASGVAFWVAGVFLLFTVVSVTSDVIMRYYFGSPLNWLTEIIETLMLYITFLGGAWVTKERSHVTVDIVLARLSEVNRERCLFLSSLVAAAVCVVLTVFGFRTTLDYYLRGVHSMTVMELPEAPKLAVIPAGALLMMGQFLKESRDHWKQIRRSRS
jgi:C4-dicarboxylate transporter DctQ subunit